MPIQYHQVILRRMGLGLLVILMVAGCARKKSTPLYDRGMAKLAQGKFESASYFLEKALENDPENPRILMQLGIAYLHVEAWPDAALVFIRAADLLPEDSRPLEFLAHVHMLEGRWSQARYFLRRIDAIEIKPATLTRLAMVEVRAKNHELAKEYLLDALRRDSSYAPALFNMARLHHLGIRDAGMAREYYQRFLNVAPNHDRAEDARGAIRALSKASSKPSSTAAKPRRWEEDVVTTTPAAKPRPDPPTEDQAGLAESMARVREAVASGDNDVALELLLSVIPKHPTNPDPLWELAILYDRNVGNLRRAIGIYGRFVTTHPDDQRTGDARRRMKEIQASLPAAKAKPWRRWNRRGSSSQIPDIELANTAFLQGRLCHEAQDYASAIHYYRQALAADPDYALVHYNLGLAYRERGLLDIARKSLVRAITLKPDELGPRIALAEILISTGKIDDALNWLNRLLNMQPDAAEGHYLLGQARRARGELDQARQAYQSYIRIVPQGEHSDAVRKWLDRHGP